MNTSGVNEHRLTQYNNSILEQTKMLQRLAVENAVKLGWSESELKERQERIEEMACKRIEEFATAVSNGSA
jgi:hypothetical protein